MKCQTRTTHVASVVLFERCMESEDDMNVVTNDVKFALSRRTFDFSRADRILKAMGLRTSNEVRGGGDHKNKNTTTLTTVVIKRKTKNENERERKRLH